MTKEQALKEGYEKFIYEKGDRFQLTNDLQTDQIDFSKMPVLVSKESSSPSHDEESIKDLIANELDGQYYDEIGDDTNIVYDKIMELDFSDITNKINEKLKEVHYFTSTQIKLTQSR